MCSQFCCNFRKKVLGPNGSYISTSQIKLRNVCLSVILEFCLSSAIIIIVVCSASTALCRSQKYLLKAQYIILGYPNVARFLIFNTFFGAGCKHCPMSENNITKMNCICLVTLSFTKHSQNMCLINIYTFYCFDMPDVTASYGMPLDFIQLFGYFYALLTIIHV